MTHWWLTRNSKDIAYELWYKKPTWSAGAWSSYEGGYFAEVYDPVKVGLIKRHFHRGIRKITLIIRKEKK